MTRRGTPMYTVPADQRSHVDRGTTVAIRESDPRHARSGPQGYPPPEAYGPIGFAPELGGAGTVPPGPGAFVPQPRFAQPTQSPPPTPPALWAPPAPAAPPRPTNPLATSGFVVALIGAVLSVLPIIGLLAWVLCPTGLGLAVAGLVQSDRRSGAGRGLGVAGVVLGALGLAASLLWLVALAR